MYIKKVVSLFLTIVLLFSVAGCKCNKSDTSESEAPWYEEEVLSVVGEAQAYINESYPDDEFTYLSYKMPNWAYQYYEIIFSSKKYNNYSVTVYVFVDQDENFDSIATSYDIAENSEVIYDYCDDYYQYLIRSEAEVYFSEKVKKYLGENVLVKVNFPSNFGAAKMAAKISSFQEYIDKGCKVGLLCCDTKKLEEIENELSDMVLDLKNSGVYSNLTYASIKEENLETIQNKSWEFIFDNYRSIFMERKDYSIYGSNSEFYDGDVIIYSLD